MTFNDRRQYQKVEVTVSWSVIFKTFVLVASCFAAYYVAFLGPL